MNALVQKTLSFAVKFMQRQDQMDNSKIPRTLCDNAKVGQVGGQFLREQN